MASVDFPGAVIFRYNPLTFIEMYDDEDGVEHITFVNFLRRNLTDSDKTRRFVCVFKVTKNVDNNISLDVVDDFGMADVPDEALGGFLELIDLKSKKLADSPFVCFLSPSFESYENAEYWVGPRFDAKVLWEHFVDVYGINLAEESKRQSQARKQAVERLTPATPSPSQTLASLSQASGILIDSPAKLPRSIRQQSSVPKSKAAQPQAKRSKNRVCLSSSPASPAISVDSDSDSEPMLQQSLVAKSNSDSSQNIQKLLYAVGTPRPLLQVVLLNGHYMLYPTTKTDPTWFGYSYSTCIQYLNHWNFQLTCDRIEEIRGGGCLVDNVAFMMVRV